MNAKSIIRFCLLSFAFVGFFPAALFAGSVKGWDGSPPDGNNFIAIAAGYQHSLALKSDGSIVAWGGNTYGQATPPDGNNFIAIAAGGYHSLALKSDGSIVGWGDNYLDEAAPPGGNAFLAIAAGGYHSLALKSDGSIVGWGYNYYGQATPPVGNNFIAIAAGGFHSLALKSDGSIVGWGDNSLGEATPPDGNNFIAIAAGGFHSLALKSDGSIVGWGWNYSGQATPPEGNNFITIAAGYQHSLALKSDGSIVGWGWNSHGETTPPAGNNFIAIAAGDMNSLALKSDGSIVALGDDSNGLTTLLYDDFTGSIVSFKNWHIPTWVSSSDGTFVGQTQFRCTQNSPLPAASGSNANITLQTYNPTALVSSPSFYGTDLISNQSFTLGQGLDITVRAKMNTSTPGIVGGIFLYDLKPGSSTLHDEIDFELLTNKPNGVQTNIYSNGPLGSGEPQFIPYASGTITDYHTYEIKWRPSQVSWFVDGILVQTDTNDVPTGPMHFHLNMWVPAEDWNDAYSKDLQPASSASSNQVFSMSVESVNIQSISPASTLTTITISPLTANLVVGGPTQQLTATTLDQRGNPIAATLTWTSSKKAVATVSSTGLVTPVAPGTTNITASSGSIKSARSIITVIKPTLKTITISPSIANLVVGGSTQQLTATAFDQRGNPIAATLKWTSSKKSVATVSSTGLVTPIAPGTAKISASSGRIKSTPLVITVTVTPPVLTTITLFPLTANLVVGGPTQQLTATTRDQRGNPITATLTWTSSNNAVATVSSTGLVTPVAPGTANISASSGSITSSAPSVITVTKPAPVLRTITISPLTANLTVGGATQQLTATTLDQYSNPIAATLTWTSSNTSVATVSSTGLVTPVRAGTANITASSSGITSAPSVITVTVTPPVLTTITLSPLTANLVVGGPTQQLTATTRDQRGNPITATLTWTSSNNAVATVSSTGLVTPVAPGTANISASSGSITSSAPSVITVTTAPVLTTITISPLSANLVVDGATQQLTATKLDQRGNPIAATLTWTSSNDAIATVSSAGLVTPVAPGTANISASSGSITSSAPSVITVASPTIHITSVPNMGQEGSATGNVVGVLPSNCSKYAVAVFIKVGSGWWTKPYSASPLTTIQSSGTWTARITTGGHDEDATEIIAYLVPSGFDVPICLGDSSLPSSLASFPHDSVTR